MSIRMGRYGLMTRAAMLVIGAIWLAAGGCWLVMLVRGALAARDLDRYTDMNETWASLASFLALGGFMLIKTATTPDRPRSSEDEVPDANPDLDLWDD